MKTILEFAKDLEENKITSRELVETSLERVNDIHGEGSATFLRDYSKRAIAMAEVSDRMRKHGATFSNLEGIPVSIKDIFDFRDEVTLAGSMIRVGTPPATSDSAVVSRLRAAGGVIVGRTNMSEFAYSGVGLNPHYGTPKNPFDRKTGRISGGSSSGAAIAVADGMCVASVGSDTGGSVRIPAALCGLTGFKPTQKRISRDGMFPLSQTLDCVGVIARSVNCCAIIDEVLSSECRAIPKPFAIEGLRVAIPQAVVFEDIDDIVAKAFEKTVSYLSRSGAIVTEIPMEELSQIVAINHKGGIVGAEAFSEHRASIAKAADKYDPMVLYRLEQGSHIHAYEYIELLKKRMELIKTSNEITQEFDVLMMPTVPIVAPPIEDVLESEDFFRVNKLLLRNTFLWNFLDRPAISIPCHKKGEAPVGLMLVGESMNDLRLLSIASGVEAVLNLMQEI